MTSLLVHSELPASNCHNSKVTTFSGNANSFTPDDSSFLYLKQDTTPMTLWYSTGQNMGNITPLTFTPITFEAFASTTDVSIDYIQIYTQGTFLLRLLPDIRADSLSASLTVKLYNQEPYEGISGTGLISTFNVPSTGGWFTFNVTSTNRFLCVGDGNFELLGLNPTSTLISVYNPDSDFFE